MISMTELLKIEHLVKYYGSRSSLTKALNDISLTVEKGEFTAIMGASGSGKTTLLNCISTIDRPTGGQIYIDGVCTSDLKERPVGFPEGQTGIYLPGVQSAGYTDCVRQHCACPADPAVRAEGDRRAC